MELKLIHGKTTDFLQTTLKAFYEWEFLHLDSNVDEISQNIRLK